MIKAESSHIKGILLLYKVLSTWNKESKVSSYLQLETDI